MVSTQNKNSGQQGHNYLIYKLNQKYIMIEQKALVTLLVLTTG